MQPAAVVRTSARRRLLMRWWACACHAGQPPPAVGVSASSGLFGLEMRNFQPARCVSRSLMCALQEQAARQAGAAAAAANALTVFDAGLAPLWAQLHPWRDSVPPCRRPPDQAPAPDASPLEALVARVSAATGLSVTLARGMGGSGGGQPTGGGAAPAQRAPCVPTAGRRVQVWPPSRAAAGSAVGSL